MSHGFTCYECGGDVVLVAMEGREVCWRGRIGYAVPADLQIPTCQRCGEWWETDAVTQALDAACEAQWVDVQQREAG